MQFQKLEDFLQEAFKGDHEAVASENIGGIVTVPPKLLYVCGEDLYVHGEDAVRTDFVFAYVEEDEGYPPVQGKRDRYYAAFSSKERAEEYLNKHRKEIEDEVDNTALEGAQQPVSDFKVGDRARLRAQYRQGRRAMDIDIGDQPGWTCSLVEGDPIEFIVEKVDFEGDLMTPEEEWVPWQAYDKVT